ALMGPQSAPLTPSGRHSSGAQNGLTTPARALASARSVVSAAASDLEALLSRSSASSSRAGSTTTTPSTTTRRALPTGTEPQPHHHKRSSSLAIATAAVAAATAELQTLLVRNDQPNTGLGSTGDSVSSALRFDEEDA